LKQLKVPTGHKNNEHPKELICNVKHWTGGGNKDPLVYFLENHEYYEQRANVYQYQDDHIRFALLSRGVIEWLLKEKWTPDVINVSDWHTGYMANYLRTEYKVNKKLSKTGLVFSIHNLPYQGPFDYKYASEIDFDDGKSRLASFFDPRLQKQNSVKRGIMYADVVNTVSEKYAQEIMQPDYGEGLDQLLREVRTKVFGILNGLDYDEFNPKTDKIIYKNFSATNLELRKENKRDLQREFNLPENLNTPLLSIQGRLTGQKGIELLEEVMPILLKEYPVQFIAMGEPDSRARDFLTKLEKKLPNQVSTHQMSNFTLPRKIFAGSDIFMLPSAYEPGGITCIEALRYGSIPVARATGGLRDTVEDYDPVSNSGYRFTFKNYTPWAFYGALVRALEYYKNPKLWRGLIRKAMLKDFSWEHAAARYTDLYLRAIRFRSETLEDNPYPAYTTMTYS
jgi:starch synthase